jgi:hypothetical protein
MGAENVWLSGVNRESSTAGQDDAISGIAFAGTRGLHMLGWERWRSGWGACVYIPFWRGGHCDDDDVTIPQRRAF